MHFSPPMQLGRDGPIRATRSIQVFGTKAIERCPRGIGNRESSPTATMPTNPSYPNHPHHRVMCVRHSIPFNVFLRTVLSTNSIQLPKRMHSSHDSTTKKKKEKNKLSPTWSQSRVVPTGRLLPHPPFHTHANTIRHPMMPPHHGRQAISKYLEPSD